MSEGTEEIGSSKSNVGVFGSSDNKNQLKETDKWLMFPAEQSFESKVAAKIIEENRAFARKSDKALERAVENNLAARYGTVLGLGTRYAVSNLSKDFTEAVTTKLPETGQKAVCAGAFTVGLRCLAPAPAAVKMAVGGILAATFVKDALKPTWDALSSATTARDLKTIDHVAKRMGHAQSEFVVDSTIGLAAGGFANWGVDKIVGGTKAIFAKPEPAENLTHEQKLERVSEYMNHVNDTISKENFHRFGKDGKSYSEFIDTLEGKLAADAKLRSKEIPLASTISLSYNNVLDNRVELAAGKSPTAPKQHNSLEEQIGSEFSAHNLSKLARVARDLQERWAPRDALIADRRHSMISTLSSVTDESRAAGSMLPPEYSASTKQLVDLVKEIRSPADLRQAYDLLYFHTMASHLVQMKEPLTLDLNNFSQAEYNSFVKALSKAGVSHKVLGPALAPINVVGDSKGGSNFTIPRIPGVTDRSVIVQDIAENQLSSVWTSINKHETGHNIYVLLMELPKEQRETLVRDMVKTGFKKAGIVDEEVQIPTLLLGGIPGTRTMMKSELFYEILMAQANENTADIFAGGHGLAPLGTLLQSVRTNGKLENRSVYGNSMIDKETGDTIGIEVHDLDISRLMRGAAQLEYQAYNFHTKADAEKLGITPDPLVLAMSKAFRKYGNEAGLPGDKYTWHSTDLNGKSFSVLRKDWDAIHESLIKLQYETPLDALEGKQWKQVDPNSIEEYNRINGLADKMCDAMDKGLHTVPSFDKSKYGVNDVFDAGMTAWARATERGQDAHNALQYIDLISRDLRSQYRTDTGKYEPLTVFNNIPNALVENTGRLAKLAAVSPEAALTYVGTKAWHAPGKLIRASQNYVSPLSALAASNYLGRIVQEEEMRQEMLRQSKQKPSSDKRAS
jgi:hypothetical protein